MKTVLVTGAAGFIGSHVSEALLKRGDRVIGLDNVNSYYNVKFKEENIKLLSKYENFSFVRADLVSISDCEKIFKENKITHVAHLAARAGVRPSIEDPFLYEQANILGTLNLLELSRKYSTENIILTSSSSVYGNSHKIPFQEDDAATDRPISPYAATKKSCELIGYTFHHLYGLNINVVRPFTVYGERGRPDMAPWLFIDAAINGKPIRKFGDGTTKRDYTYIGDFVDGFVNAIDRVYGYEIFNLGNSATVSLNDALKVVQEIVKKDLNVIQCPMQPGDVEITNANIDKAKKMLDYNPKTSFAEGMKKFYDWFITNRA